MDKLMEITAFKPDHFPDMAALFVQAFRKLRAIVPVLPDTLEDTSHVVSLLEGWGCQGIVALDQGKASGYLGWIIVDEFRGTERRGVYCPEWAHGAADGIKQTLYRAMYRVAAREWADAGCGVHSLRMLAHERETEQAWFWNGFGLTVVDGIRSIQPVGAALPSDISIRQATTEDVDLLSLLEAEHARHYSEPPVFMVGYELQDADTIAASISQPEHSMWLALDGSVPVGFMRFQPESFGAASVVNAPDKVAITGAYIRPQYRGRRAGAALLDAALKEYATRGFGRCSVDFESFNPEATSFWMKYFAPVCLSVVRVPERQPVLPPL